MKNNFEIERKYLIEFPNTDFLNNNRKCTAIDLSQTYLNIEDKSFTARIRQSDYKNKTVYTKTVKYRISGIKCVEIEDEITKDEYDKLMKSADLKLNTINKTRFAYSNGAHLFEIDVYPFWKDRAVMEVELDREDEKFIIPSFINIIKEVTDDVRYKNFALAKKVPFDEI